MPNPIIAILEFALGLYFWIVFFYFLIELLCYFNVVNMNEPVVIKARRLLASATEPVLAKIRKYIKPYNGFDLAPLILVLVIKFLQYCLIYYFG